MGRDFGLPGASMGKANENTLAALEALQALTEGFYHPINCEIGAVGGCIPRAGSAAHAWFHGVHHQH